MSSNEAMAGALLTAFNAVLGVAAPARVVPVLRQALTTLLAEEQTPTSQKPATPTTLKRRRSHWTGDLEITGAFIDDSLGGNGAAIRDQQDHVSFGLPTASLTLDNVLIDNNQAGILQGNDAAEIVTITNSQFINNGNPDICCFTHGVYIDAGAALTVQGSMFCGQLIGHDIKSRAAQTTILNSQIYSAEGGPPSCQVANTSFDIDVPNGGVVMIMGNTIVQGPSAQNHKMVNYGEEGLVYSNNSAMFATNTFISTTSSIAIEDPPCIPMVVAADNTFTGVSQVVDPPSCGASAAPPPPPPPLSPAPPPPAPGTPAPQMHPHRHHHG